LKIPCWFLALSAVLLFARSLDAQAVEADSADTAAAELVVGPHFSPAKYRILRVHLLPPPTDAQSATSRGRFMVNFGSRDGVQRGSIFQVHNLRELVALVRVHQVWRDSASVQLVHLIRRPNPNNPQPLKKGYYLEPKFVLLETVFFEQGKPVFSPEMHEQLHYASRFIRSYPDFPLVLEGHTDDRGPKADNAKLSVARAATVMTYLKEVHHIPAEQMQLRGLGETHPIATNGTEAGRKINRRVDIILMEKTVAGN
jgi:outer membrane protein OmpA-like peptidoglycan-associated protein